MHDSHPVTGYGISRRTASKPYDLAERTFEFARDVRTLMKTLPRTISNIEDMKQLAKSSGSVGANYIEGNDALSRKDARMRLRISRKEARESVYWLRLLDTGPAEQTGQIRADLIQEGSELVSIFSSILQKMTDERSSG